MRVIRIPVVGGLCTHGGVQGEAGGSTLTPTVRGLGSPGHRATRTQSLQHDSRHQSEGVGISVTNHLPRLVGKEALSAQRCGHVWTAGFFELQKSSSFAGATHLLLLQCPCTVPEHSAKGSLVDEVNEDSSRPRKIPLSQ